MSIYEAKRRSQENNNSEHSGCTIWSSWFKNRQKWELSSVMDPSRRERSRSAANSVINFITGTLLSLGPQHSTQCQGNPVEQDITSPPRSKGEQICCSSNGRNICVSADGTLGELGAKVRSKLALILFFCHLWTHRTATSWSCKAVLSRARDS